MLLSTTKSASLLNNIVGKSASVSIGTNGACYLALFTTMPSDSGTGYVEVSANYTHYSRERIDTIMNTTYQSHALSEASATSHSRRIGNADDIMFGQAYNPDNPDATTGADWGTLVGWGLFSVSTVGSGDPYAWGLLGERDANGDFVPEAVTISTHDVFLFRKGCFELYIEDGDVQASAAV